MLNDRSISCKWLAVCAMGLAMPSAVLAAPQIEYEITGNFSQPNDAPNATLENTGYFNTYIGGGTSGGQEIYSSPFDIFRTELFSDPDITPTPYEYANIRQFAFFGVYSLNTDERHPSLFIAALPGTAASITQQAIDANDPGVVTPFTLLLGSYISTHLNSDTPDELTLTLINGPDYPNPGEGLDAIDFGDFIGGNSPFLGDVGTTFQTAQTLELINFDSAGNATVIGEITTNANLVPEPASLGLLGVGGLLLARRRRA